MSSDWRRVLREFPPWEGLPANQDTAIERVEAHLAHRRTDVTDVKVHRHSNSPMRFRIRFADGTSMFGQYGFVIHSTQVPGAEVDDSYATGDWRFNLPINRLHGPAGHADSAAIQPLHCGVRQPAGAECFICGERVGEPDD